MKTKIVASSILLVVAVVGIVLVSIWWRMQLTPIGQDETPVAFVVVPGEAGIQIANKLEQSNLIRSALVARLYMKSQNIETRIVPGSFVLRKNMSVEEIFRQLRQGPQDIWVTIPEGWRREQVADRMVAQIGPSFIVSDFLTQTEDLEGQLFPDTYLIPATAQAADVVRIMTTNFTRKSGLSLPADRDILILASLIEREGKTDTDRPIIAGILTNRLDAGWPLQVDATVQYARDQTDWWAPLFDTKFPSLFNTYLHTGLPPAPIASPGLASIKAALEPRETPYWYYIHSPDGVVHYGRNLDEHNANIDKYLRP